MGMGSVYILVGLIRNSFEVLPFMALLLQVILGFLQGYYHAWHIEQKAYRLHAINHYLLVGLIMVGLSFVKILSPIFFITAFGTVLLICGIRLIFMKNEGSTIGY
jgi:ABC-type multidrug transport system permease subunit